MKILVKISIFYLILVLACLIPTAQANAATKKSPKKVATILKVAIKKPEARLKITRIGVDAVIKDMGLTSDNAMAVPDNVFDVGWYSLGTRPGEIGTAVIGAHNELHSRAGVFANLNKLKKGDILSVVDAKGVSVSFMVRDIKVYDAIDTSTEIFQSESGSHLNLITCSGAWDPQTKSSKERLVIFTDIIPKINTIALVSR